MIYDISQPVFECAVYPGDPHPVKTQVCSIEKGDICNLTSFQMCAHNGTHVDAPAHFINEGKGISEVCLEKFIGKAIVVSHIGEVSAEDAKRFVAMAAVQCKASVGLKILIKGDAVVTLEAARIFAEAKVDLIGNESQTVGPEDAPMAIHMVLLGAEVVLLEGIRLAHVSDGLYLLNCAPLNLGSVDGAPCRATLMKVSED